MAFPLAREAARFCTALPLNVRRAWRAAMGRPAYALTVVGTIALVMAAAAVAFVIFDATVLRPLPYPENNRLAVIYTVPPGVPDRGFRNPLHSVDLIRFRRYSRTLMAVEGLVAREHAVTVAGEPEAHIVGHASAGLIDLLGLKVILGRSFTPEEDRNQHKVAVLSHFLWQSAFGGDTRALGAKILVDGEPHDVIGVLDTKARVPFANADLWTPLGISEANLPLPFATFILGIGRLAPGVSLKAASQEMQQIMTDLSREQPKTHNGWRAVVVSLREWQFGEQRYVVSILMLAALAVLAVAWINILNISIADLLGRRYEMTVCVSLGAARSDLIATQLVSVTSLIGLGVLIGLMTAAWMLRVVQTLGASSLGPVGELRVDAHAQLFAGIVTTLAALIVGVIPVIRATRLAGPGAGNRVIGSRKGRLIRAGLVASQVAAVVTLVAGTLVLVRTLHRQSHAPLGFNFDGVLAVKLRMPSHLHPSVESRAEAVRTFIESARELPGVNAVGSVTNPLSPGQSIVTQVEIEGLAMPNGQPTLVQFRMVSGDYFRAVRIPLLSGRALSDTDSVAAPLAAVVSRLFAERFWPGRSAIGQRLRRPVIDPRWITVVGVVDDVSDVQAGQTAQAILYMPYAQFNVEVAPIALMVRTNGDPSALIVPARRAILNHNPSQPIYSAEPLRAFIDASFAPQQFRTLALAFLALLGIALGAVGIYGVISRVVAERVPEIGIRKVLGASSWGAVVTAGRDTAMAVGMGVVLGAALSIGAGRFLASILPDLDRLDAMIATCAALATLAVAIFASVEPLRRAFHIDPLRALKGL